MKNIIGRGKIGLKGESDKIEDAIICAGLDEKFIIYVKFGEIEITDYEYDQQSLNELFEIITPYVSAGYINYHGNDDTEYGKYWKLVFDEKTRSFIEYEGNLVFSANEKSFTESSNNLADVWIYVSGLPVRKCGVVIASSKEEALQKVYEMYGVGGWNPKKEDIHILSKTTRIGAWRNDCPDVLEVWDWIDQEDSVFVAECIY